MDDARDVTEDGKQDVDEEIGAAATLKEDTERREDDGEDDLDDIANEKKVCQCPNDSGACAHVQPKQEKKRDEDEAVSIRLLSRRRPLGFALTGLH